MKYLKTADFIGQSTILVFYVLASVWVAIAEKRWSAIGMTTALALLCLGWWQMISALVMLLTGAPNRTLRLVHFTSSIAYLIILATAGRVASGDDGTITIAGRILFTAAVATPIILATLYYFLTCKLVFPNHSNGHFLPHTSF